MTAPTPKLGAAMTDSQWILDVMGRYDFTMPQAAFDEIVRKLLARQPAAIGKEAVGQWVHCSPSLLSAGVSCANTPRRACECNPENGGHDHFIAHSAAPLDKEASKPAAQSDDLLPNALWTRNGSGSLEWWTFKGYEARKDAADQWVLRRAGAELYRHTHLQVVMAHAERAILAAPPAAPSVAQDSENTDDIAVESFARAMKEKMAQSRAKGRSGWEGCEPAALSRMLREHVEKGDPRDVANFCMMLWHHSAPIAPSARTANVAQGAETVGYYLEYGSGRYDVIPAWATADKNQALLVKQRGSPVYRVAPPAQTALADDARDAARYRWLRRRAFMLDESDDAVTTISLFKDEGPTGEFLDDQIDAALSQHTGEKDD